MRCTFSVKSGALGFHLVPGKVISQPDWNKVRKFLKSDSYWIEPFLTFNTAQKSGIILVDDSFCQEMVPWVNNLSVRSSSHHISPQIQRPFLGKFLQSNSNNPGSDLFPFHMERL